MSKKGVLIIAHGSRAKETEIGMNEIVEMVKDKLPDYIIQIAYMEFGETTIEKGLLNLVEAGVSDIHVAPYFLFEGVHIKKDIPEELARVKTLFPNLNISLGKPLGVDIRLADILVDRIINR